MKVKVIGSGEAFDSVKTNSSFLVEHNNKNILIDCGFTVPRSLWFLGYGNNIDAIYLTHFHADHTFGVPALLIRMVEDIRTSTLQIFGQKGIKEFVLSAIDLAYKGFFPKIGFRIDFIEVEPEKETEILGLKMYFAPTQHSVTNYAIWISDNTHSISISGDGAPTKELISMYKEKKPSVIVQECYSETKSSNVHTSLEDVVSISKELKHNPQFILTHISRNEIVKVRNSAKQYGFMLAEEGQYIA